MGDEVAQLPLGLGPQDVERRHRHLDRAELRLSEETPDLGAVPVRHYQLAPRRNDGRERGGGSPHLAYGFPPRSMVVGPLDRVAPQGDQQTGPAPAPGSPGFPSHGHAFARFVTQVMQWAPPYPPVIS